MRALIATISLVGLAGCETMSEARSPAPTAPADVVIDGNKLKQWCTTTSGYSACLHYIAGVVDGADVMSAIAERMLPYCAPDNVTFGQTRDVVVKFLNDNPKYLHQYAGVLILYAMKDAFPCEK